jgi:hypothetical protein
MPIAAVVEIAATMGPYPRARHIARGSGPATYRRCQARASAQEGNGTLTRPSRVPIRGERNHRKGAKHFDTSGDTSANLVATFTVKKGTTTVASSKLVLGEVVRFGIIEPEISNEGEVVTRWP